ncbi:MAG TPA: carboxypeptidase regulatory-like domain-containing protein [Terracidiphilus sp.]|nr:carboxypeptidase regulatory-like domain-containing protein [Terracidiphilus sp.]
MRLRGLILLCSFTVMAVGLHAQAITGTILIKKKLTKPSVTASVSVYQRGTAVKLGKDAEQDPIAYERSRVVIYLEGPVPADQNQGAPATQQIQQLDRRFMPDMVVVPIGSTVTFPNMDPIFHNIYSLSKPKSFDLGSYDKGETRKVTFPKPGIVEIYCHLHPNMEATVVVTPNRWYARPDRNGQYRIPDVPAGQYTVVAWHRSAGFFRKTVVIENGRDVAADFFIPLEIDSRQEAEKDHEPGRSGGSR